MNIRKRILLAMGILFFFTCMMFLITWYVSGLQQTDGLVINLAGRQRMLTQKISKEYLLTLATNDAGQKAEFRKLLAQSIEVFERTHKALSDGGPAPLTLNPAGKQGQLPKSTGLTTERLREASALTERFLAYIRLKSQNGEMRTAEEGALEGKVLAALNSSVEAMQLQSEEKIRFMLQAQGLCIVLSLLALVVLVIMMQKGLFRPLDKLLAYSDEVASGSLDATPEGTYIHELLTLKNSLQLMVNNLRNALQEASAHEEIEARSRETAMALDEARRQEEETRRLLAAIKAAREEVEKIVASLHEASERLTSEVTQVTQGAERQCARLDDMSISMDEMNTALTEMADGAGLAADNAQTTEDSASSGAGVVKNLLSATNTVRGEVVELRSGMDELGKQVDGITVIMQIINDIADQTNLLALNAAIEAARAGDAGRGFAVVADEVRKLAEKTMEATAQVGKTVQAIQKDTQSSIDGVSRAAKGTEDVASLAQDSENSLDDILRFTGQTAGQAREIAGSAKEQTASGAAIRKALEEVTAISQETRRGMEEAFKAIADISTETKGLHELIKNMKS